jgi:hypothetical protein
MNGNKLKTKSPNLNPFFMSTRPKWTRFWILRANPTHLNPKIGPKIGLNPKKRVGFGNTNVPDSVWRIYAKRRNRNGHFKCTKKHKITPRSFCLRAIMLLSIYFEFISVDQYKHLSLSYLKLLILWNPLSKE